MHASECLLYFCRLLEQPYWMLFPVMVDTKLREGSMSNRFFVRELFDPNYLYSSHPYI